MKAAARRGIAAYIRPIRVFFLQGFYVWLLGSQTLNVVSTSYGGAAFVSLILGLIGFNLTAMIADVKREWTPEWWAFIAAGPIGICLAIWTGPIR